MTFLSMNFGIDQYCDWLGYTSTMTFHTRDYVGVANKVINFTARRAGNDSGQAFKEISKKLEKVAVPLKQMIETDFCR